jgi:hypothetical protein
VGATALLKAKGPARAFATRANENAVFKRFRAELWSKNASASRGKGMEGRSRPGKKAATAQPGKTAPDFDLNFDSPAASERSAGG